MHVYPEASEVVVEVEGSAVSGRGCDDVVVE
jgi:hypothetical protein